MAQDPTYGGDLQASTLDDMVADVAYQNFFTGTAKQAYLRAIGAVDPFDGGVMMREPFVMNRPQGGATAPGSNLTITHVQQLADLAFIEKLYTTQDLIETFSLMTQNRGAARKVDLLELYSEQAIEAINTDVEVDSYHHGQAASSGTVADDGTLRVNGDAEAMNNGLDPSWDGNVYQNYGNQARNGAVSSTLNSTPFWYGNSDGSAGTITVDALIQHILRAAQFGHNPDIGITTPQGYGYILAALQRQQRFTDWSVGKNETVPDWTGINFMGTMIHYDILAPGTSWGAAFPSTVSKTSNATSRFTSPSTTTALSGIPASTSCQVGETLFLYSGRSIKYRPTSVPEFFFGTRRVQVWNNNTVDSFIVNLALNMYFTMPRDNNHGFGFLG
jgi:hypothetical protein